MSRSQVSRWGRLGVAALALVASCGGTTSGASTRPSRAADEVEAAAQRVVGRYAHYDVVAYESSDMKTLIISYGFTDLRVEDGALTAEDSFCSSEHRSDQPIDVVLSDAATQAIDPVPTDVALTVVDGRARLSRPETPTGIGVELADPANEPLPTDPTDPRIADDDNDGKPGVTARISASGDLVGEIYLARREIFAYVVDEQSDASLVGTVSDRSEQLVIGASNDAFLTQAEWVQHDDLAKSPILLVPVDDTWDCARLMSERDRIFPPTPDVDW